MPATLFCPSCGDEYVAGSQICSDCRVALVAERPERPIGNEAVGTGLTEGFVELGQWPPLAAVIVLRRLADAGVQASTLWSVPTTQLAAVAVPEGQLEFADAVLRELPIEDELPQQTTEAYIDRIEARLTEVAMLLDELRQVGVDRLTDDEFGGF